MAPLASKKDGATVQLSSAYDTKYFTATNPCSKTYYVKYHKCNFMAVNAKVKLKFITLWLTTI